MRIVVVGDVLLDRDLDGPSTRLTPDGGVPVVDVERDIARAGGAGLVARLLATDGHDVRLVTVTSDDGASHLLRHCLSDVQLVSGPSGAPTPVKTRILKSAEPVVRIDEGCAEPPLPGITPWMLEALEDAEAIVVADYGRGLLANPALRNAIARRLDEVPVVWDPHPRGTTPLPGIAAATPNFAEALAFAGLPEDCDSAVGARAAAILRTAWQVGAMVVTAGADGAWVHAGADEGSLLVPARPLADVDTCGAGDRFAASLAVELAIDSGRIPEAVAAAIDRTADFLGHGGVASLPGPAEKGYGAGLQLRPDAIDVVRLVRNAGGTVVATGGCFDLLHAGHVRTLRAARELGDALIVCLNTDASVRRLKGPGRPLMSEADRIELLLALDCVDAVALFDEDTPLRILDKLRPDIWVKGGDYIAELLPEHRLLSDWGGRCEVVPFHPGRSTSALAAALDRVAS